MVNLYVTPDEIRDYLGVDSSKYSDTFLENLITMHMDYIDWITETTWNGNSKTAREYHDITRPKWGFWIWRLGYPVFLTKNHIRSIDKLLVFQGSEYQNWIGDPAFTEGRNGDYFVDYEEGIIYLNVFMIPMAGKEIIVEYTYGRDDLPGQIKQLCLYRVVRDLISNERRLFALPDGAEAVSFREQLTWLDNRIAELEEMVRAWKMSIIPNP